MSRLSDVLLQGTHAARPAAAAGNTAYAYFETDTQTLFQSNGSAWVQIAAAANVTAGAVGAVANAGGAPSLQVGVDASKPAAGTAGRLYVATDTGNLYEDSGSAWGVVATVQWANLSGKPSTFTPSAHESTHLLAGSDALAGVDQTQIDVDATEASTNDSLSGGNLRTNLRRIRYQLAQLGTGAWNTLVAMVQLSPGSQQTGTINVSGEVQGSDFKPGGLTGATQVSRYVGATASGAPVSGTFAVGDFVVDRSGQIWICTTAGTPGTWTQVSGSGGSVTSVGLTMPAEFSVAGSPITGAGTLAVTKANESANTLFGGPTSGGAAAPTFRSLVSADLPSAPTVSGEVTGSDFKPSGLTGATSASRLVGATTSGAPASGTFAVGDVVVDQSGTFYICTTAGTPGTWTQVKGNPTFSGEVSASDFKPSGLTGATAAVRFVGGTASAAPTTGTFAVGDFVITQAGSMFICTTAGTPGTWTQVSGGGGGGSSTLAGDTDVAIASPVGGQVLGYNGSTAKWQNQNVAGVAATTQTAQLGADVSMTSANTFYDGPSVSLSPGTWVLLGSIYFSADTTNGSWTAKLWDGTTVAASAENANVSGLQPSTLTLAGIVTPTTTTTYKISAACTGAGNRILAAVANNAAGNNASYLRAIQLSGNPVGQQAPAVRCYNSANISVSNNTWTALTFDTNRFDQGTSTAQHSTSSNTNRLTCQQAGVYQISAVLAFAFNATGVRYVRVRLNGATDIIYDDRQTVTSDTSQTIVSLSGLYNLSVGDYVELLVYQSSGGPLNVVNSANISPEFGMARIDSGPGAVQPNTKVQLDYALASGGGLLNPASAVTANTWNSAFTAQSFSVDDAQSVVEICVSGELRSYWNGTGDQVTQSRILIDGSAAYALGGEGASSSALYANALSGTGDISVTGLSAGSHTITVQIQTNRAAFCSVGDIGLTLTVLERKQSASPPSSTPAPAVRCYNNSNSAITASTITALTFNTNRFDQGTSTAQHSTSSNTSRLVCQQSGIYYIAGNIQWSGSPSANETDLIIRLNGTTTIGQWQNVGTDQRRMAVSTLYQLNVGDYVELIVYTGASGLSIQSDGNDSPEFMMARIDSGGQGFVPIPMVKTASYTLTAQDCMVVANADSTTMTLPAASSRAPGMPIVVKNGAHTGTTIVRAGSDTIDGATSYALLAQYAAVTLVSDGVSAWYVI